MKLAASLAALATMSILAGCAEAVGPTLSQNEYQTIRSEMTRLAALPRPRFYEMPTDGLVTYRGAIASNMNSLSGVVGSLEMNVDFATSDITGTIRDVNFINSGVPEQTLDGTLALTGQVTNSLMDATASGPLTAVAYGIPATVDATLNLTGKFRNENAIADTITGSVSGSLTGVVNHSFGSGTFYAQADEAPE